MVYFKYQLMERMEMSLVSGKVLYLESCFICPYQITL
ncbi:Uncharacterised protein [Edwardsiella tarda]|nr:Uncharacterised protein [Edwardsiella tarda]